MGRKRLPKSEGLPERVYLGKSAYEWRPKGGKTIRLCHKSASIFTVFYCYERAVQAHGHTIPPSYKSLREHMGEAQAGRAPRNEALLNERSIQAASAPISSICGVYFLLSDGEIVYVGASRNIMRRVSQHLDDDSKTFDSVSFIETSEQAMFRIESAYIEKFRPKLNEQTDLYSETVFGKDCDSFGKRSEMKTGLI